MVILVYLCYTNKVPSEPFSIIGHSIVSSILGRRGTVGDKGRQGIRGGSGLEGETGFTGSRGPDGPDGSNGRDGNSPKSYITFMLYTGSIYCRITKYTALHYYYHHQ